MIINPIIPIWIMTIISFIFIILIYKNKKKIIKYIFIIILAFIINLRIMITSPNAKVSSNNLDVLFVIDNTISMLAEDYNGNNQRLEAVKNDCRYIINELAGSRFSIITFNNDSKRLIPYTKDVAAVQDMIDIIDVMDELYAKGTTLNTPIDEMTKSLEAASKKEGRKQIVFFISDGEITNGEKLKSFREPQKYIDNGVVMGYGTTNGGKMKINNKYTNTSKYLKDTTDLKYEDAISKIDETNLKEIAKDMEIDYIKMDEQKNLESKLKEIKTNSNSNLENELKEGYVDIYYIFTIPIILILFYEYINYKRRFAV